MLDRKIPPPYHKIDKIQIIQAHTQYLSNHLPLHVLNAGDLDLLRIELIFPAGSQSETQNGVSYFTTKMLGEGTSKHTSAEIVEFIDNFGAFADFNHGSDRISISLYTLSKHLEKLLPIFLELITDSVFPQNELENLKNITLQNIKVNEEKNNYIASKKFRELLFGQEHPYGRSLDEEAIQKIERNNLIQYFQSKILYQPFDLMLSGKITDTEVALVHQIFGHLPIRSMDIHLIKHDLQGSKQLTYIFEKEGSLQSSVRMGKILFTKNHPDYFKVTVANEIFGGYFGSRLMKNIREQKGYTYGIYSNLVMMKDYGYLNIGTDVKKEFTAQTIEEIHKESQKIRTALVDAKELETVKNYMLGSFAGSMNTPFDLGEVFKSLYFNGLEYSFYDKYIETIKSITAEEILETAQKYLDTEDMLTVVVGGKKIKN